MFKVEVQKNKKVKWKTKIIVVSIEVNKQKNEWELQKDLKPVPNSRRLVIVKKEVKLVNKRTWIKNKIAIVGKWRDKN